MPFAEHSLREEKRAIRRAMTETRNALTAEERQRRSEQVTQRLLTLPEIQTAKTVAGYVATRSEINPEPLLLALQERGARVVLPRIANDARPPRLRFHAMTHRSDLVYGMFGLLEPRSDSPEIPALGIEAYLVPGLAFDHQGGRIGYGGGYYDEILAYVRTRPEVVSTVFVGIAFDFQLLSSCPAGAWDAPMDCVVTDERIIRCGTDIDQGST